MVKDRRKMEEMEKSPWHLSATDRNLEGSPGLHRQRWVWKSLQRDDGEGAERRGYRRVDLARNLRGDGVRVQLHSLVELWVSPETVEVSKD